MYKHLYNMALNLDVAFLLSVSISLFLENIRNTAFKKIAKKKAHHLCNKVNSCLDSSYFCPLLITFKNSLDRDQD